MTPHVITQLLIWLPNPGQRMSDLEQRRVSIAAQLSGLHAVQGLPFGLWTSGKPDQPCDGPHAWLDVAPGKAASGRSFAAPDDGVAALTGQAEAQAQVFNLLHWTPADGGGLSLLSDMASIRPLHIARSPSGTWLASRILDLLSINPDWCQPLDRLGLQSLLVFRGIYNDRTLHEPVRRVPPGSVLRWRPGGEVETDQSRRFRVASEDIGADLARFTRDAGEALRASYRRLVREPDQPVPLALSGGYDSRLLGGVGKQAGIRQHAYSYGKWYHDDPWLARQIARRLGIPFNLVAFDRDETLRQLDERVALTEGCTDPMVGQTALREQPGMALGTPLVHGYAGDTSSGAFIDRIPSAAYDSHDAVAAGIHTLNSRNEVDGQPLFGFTFQPDALIADMAGKIDRSQSTLHACNLFWLENHKRRFVSGLYMALGETFDLLWPLFDREYFDAWGRLPRSGLEFRTAMNFWFRREFPELVKVPHASGGLLVPNLKSQLGMLAYDLPFSLLSRIGGRGEAWLHEKGLGRTTYHWHNLLLAHHQQQMQQRISAGEAALSTRLGISLQPGYWAALEGKPQARRLLLGVATWARQLDARLAQVDALL